MNNNAKNNVTDTVSVTIQMPRKTYEVFQKAGNIVGQVGFEIPVKKIVEMMATAEFADLEPNKVAKRFTQSIEKALKGAIEMSATDEDDEEALEEPETKLETVRS